MCLRPRDAAGWIHSLKHLTCQGASRLVLGSLQGWKADIPPLDFGVPSFALTHPINRPVQCFPLALANLWSWEGRQCLHWWGGTGGSAAGTGSHKVAFRGSWAATTHLLPPLAPGRPHQGEPPHANTWPCCQNIYQPENTWIQAVSKRKWGLLRDTVGCWGTLCWRHTVGSHLRDKWPMSEQEL